MAGVSRTADRGEGRPIAAAPSGGYDRDTIGARGIVPSAAGIRVDRRASGNPIERDEISRRAMAAMLAHQHEGGR